MKKRIKLNSSKAVQKMDDNVKQAHHKDEPKELSYFQLFRFATCWDIFCILVGVLMSVISGAITPLLFILFGDLTGSLVDFKSIIDSDQVNDPVIMHEAESNLMTSALNYLINNCILGVIVIVLSYFSTVLITMPSIRQISKIRSLYMSSVLNKDISWYDTNQTSDFSSRITEDLRKIEDAIGDKISTFSYYMSVFLAGVITGLIYGWELALMCFIYFPVSMVAMGLVSWVSNKLVREEMEAYARAASIAEEVIGAIRTIVAFDGQHKETHRYKDALRVAKSNNIKRGFFTALNNGFMWLFVFFSYALSFYYGVKLILDERGEENPTYTPANMITVFFNILVATWNFGQCAPFFQIFAAGKAAAAKIYSVIEEPPIINLSKRKGMKPKSFEGNIRFDNVHFQYPSRAEVKILQGLNLDIKRGETVALVGNSGCGKSTCIQLIQRFYDPVHGQVIIDGINMKEYDLKWLRNRIGVVGQEPILFGTTIEENIRYGNQNALFEDIEAAARKANAHNFIEKLPNGYQTLVGERGAQMSGGQKQRIAIARALVRNPTILLLDEATSALDTHSEALVQDALDNASKDCTTIIVAHRLSTIRGADRIIVISEGAVIEDGTHDTLMSKAGAYFKLVTAQTTDPTNDDKLENGQDSSNDFLGNKEDNLEMMDRKKSVEESAQEKEAKMGTFRILHEILKLNKPEWWLIFLGSIGAIVQGASIPMYAVIFGDVIGILSNPDNEAVRADGNRFSLYFCIIAVACGIASFLQTYLLAVSGEKLTLRVRTRMFDTMVKQEMAWYDRPEHGVGALCTTLSSDASGIQGAAGQPIGTALTSLSSLGIAIILSFIFEWRLTLVTLCFVPVIFISIYFEATIVNDGNSGSKDSIENSAKYAIEAISNIRTVASLGIEKVFHVKYLELLGPHYRRAQKGGHMRGIVLGMARSLMFFCYAVVTYYGATLIRDEHLDFAILLKVSEALVSGAWAVGTAVAFTPNFQKGVVASAKLLKLLARVPTVQDGQNSTPLSTRNLDVSYEKISFSYPTRPGVEVLRGLDLNVFHGKTVALVGPSGCGKSTIVQLLERFYDPRSGAVSLGDRNIKFMKLSSLRSHLGIVSQEPNLFDRTIMENIAYGDNTREVTPDEVISAAKKANIHKFIVSLPLGYETRLGDKGTQLSGGQKQRVAIARALVRDPPILLLDEATSALDTESEKIVQEALDKAKSGRTCITIAHRLVTIQDADVICVINKGVVEEMGSHSELLDKRGIYHQLYNLQMGRA